MISRKYWEKYHAFVFNSLEQYSESVALRIVEWVVDDESLLYLSNIIEENPSEDEIVRFLDVLTEPVKMKVKYINETNYSLTNGKIYTVVNIENGLYRIIDNSGEDYLCYPDEFEIIETQ